MKTAVYLDYHIVAQLRAIASLDGEGTAEVLAEVILTDHLAKTPEIAELVAAEAEAKTHARQAWLAKWRAAK